MPGPEGGDPSVRLHAGGEDRVRGRHPWIAPDAVAEVRGDPVAGDPVRILDTGGTAVARGLWEPAGPVRVRVYAWNRYQRVDAALLTVRVGAAVAVRERLGLMGEAEACRLVHGEGDGLSGLVVDRYGDRLVATISSPALWAHRRALMEALDTHAPSRGRILRGPPGTDPGEEQGSGTGVGSRESRAASEAPGDPELSSVTVEIVEDGLRYRVTPGDVDAVGRPDLALDLRECRRLAARHARGRRVADATPRGAHLLPALLAGGAASVTRVARAEDTADAARGSVELNGLDSGAVERVASEAGGWLAAAVEAGRRFEMAVVQEADATPVPGARPGPGQGPAGDPGDAALLALNEAAVRVLEPGGLLLTGAEGPGGARDRLRAVLAEVERRTTRRMRILEARGPSPDFPGAPTCPEAPGRDCLLVMVE